MDIFILNTLHKLFIILYNLLLVYGFYFDYKEKKKIKNKIENKINKECMTELVLEIDNEEKYMLKNLAYEYGCNSIEDYIIMKLNSEINNS